MDFNTYIWFTINNGTLRVLQEFDDIKSSPFPTIIYRLHRYCTISDCAIDNCKHRHCVNSCGDGIRFHIFAQLSTGVMHYVYDKDNDMYAMIEQLSIYDPRFIIHGCILEVYTLRWV